MKVKRNTLLLLACLVWGAAGFNVLRIGLQTRGIAPDRFIAVFYSGLGASLFLAGMLFGCHYIKALLGHRHKANQR